MTKQYSIIKRSLLSLSILATFQSPLLANPSGAQIINGQVSIDTSIQGITNITNSPGSIINWQDFSVAQDEITRFIQQSSQSAVLNRVIGQNPSQILGQLISNGQVFVINPNGIVFGANSIIDTQGLIASTLNLSNQDFLSGNYHFIAGSDASGILNEGVIRTGKNGNIVLIAPDIENNGIIQTDGGKITLAAGEELTLTSLDDPQIRFQVQATDNEVLNLGQVLTNGGAIDLFAGTITHSGEINADSLTLDSSGNITFKAQADITLTQESQINSKAGSIHIESDTEELLQQGDLTANQIHLIGAMVNNVGVTQATSTNTNIAKIKIEADYALQQGELKAVGGNIDIQANSLYHSGLTSADDPTAAAGNITITTSNRFDATGDSLISATGINGGSITLDGSTGQVVTSATLDVSGTQSGGIVEVTAGTVALLNANIKADGDITGGNIHIGGEWQGSGDLEQAKEVIIGAGTELSATGETGGEIVIWSTESTSFYGSADTSGTQQGGQIELSSLGNLDWMGPDFAPITPGNGGLLLLDPKDIIVTDTPPSGLSLATKLAEGSNVVTTTQTLTLTDSGLFSVAVSLDGDLLAISAPSEDLGGADRGAVYLFNGVGTDFSGLTLQDKLADGWTDGISILSLTDSDWFGRAISLDGDKFAVGAYLDDTGGTDRGAVYLFNSVGTDYSNLSLQVKLTDGWTDGFSTLTLTNTDTFGSSISLDADFLAISAPGDDAGSTSGGAVYLFNGVGTDFTGLTLQDKLADGWTDGITTLTLVNSEFFGPVSLSGDQLAVGAPGDNTGASSSGAVYLFNGVGTDFTGLTLQDKLADGWTDGISTLILTTNLEQFGSALSLDGDRLVISAQGDDTGGTDRGAVYLFNGVGTDFTGLTLQYKLADGWTDGISTLNLVNADFFGFSVALDGDRLVAGSHLEDTGGTNRGAAYLFNGVGSDYTGLTLLDKLAHGSDVGTASQILALRNSDEFGTALSLDGDRLAVGSQGNDIGGTDRGAVYLFNGVGSDYSGLTLQLKLADGWSDGIFTLSLKNSDYFGSSISLDQDFLAVGAYGENTPVFSNAGAVYLFNGVGTDYSGLTLQDKLADGWTDGTFTLTMTHFSFGSAVSLDGDRLAVGSGGNDTGGTDRGAVYLFNGVGTDYSGLTHQDTLVSGWSDGVVSLALTNGDAFGYSVSLDGDLLAVGAWGDDTGGSAFGAVYLFNGVGTNYSGLTIQDTLENGWTNSGTTLTLTSTFNSFGYSVSLDGNHLAVGARRDSSDQGAVYLFNNIGIDYTNLILQDKLASGWTDGSSSLTLATADFFGSSVSLDGDRLAVGAEWYSTDRGAVYLFNSVGADYTGLTLQTKLTDGSLIKPTSQALSIADSDQFGDSLSLDGDRLAIGASGDTNGRGAVYLFNGVGTDYSGITLQDKLVNGWTDGISTLTLAISDAFGSAISLDSDLLAVGAFGDDTGGTNRGAVYLFNGVGSDYSNLSLQQKMAQGWTDGSSTLTLINGHNFGWAVSLDGDHLAVGAIGEDNGRGAAYLFNGVGADFTGLTLQDRLVNGWTDGASTLTLAFDAFGSSVSIDGDRLIVGSFLDDTGGSNKGTAYLFNGVGTDYTGLTLQQKMAQGWTDGTSTLALPSNAGFGDAVSLDGDWLAVGRSGSVYLFNGVGTDFSDLTLQDELTDGWTDGSSTLTVAGDGFGSSVSLAGDRLAVGAYGDDTGGSNRGAVYLFNGLSGGGSGVVGDAIFATNPADTLYLTPLSITNILDTGAALTLQANNDITISNDITVDEGGAGGSFTLQAGRSIFINADIFTDAGDFIAYANTTGGVSANRDAGDAILSLQAGNSIDTSSGRLQLIMHNGYGPAGDIEVGGTLTSDQIWIGGFVAGSRISLLSTALIDAGTTNPIFTADDLNIEIGASILANISQFSPFTSTLSLGIAGGIGDIEITEAELNAFDSGLAQFSGADITIDSFTADSGMSYRFYSMNDLTVTSNITLPLPSGLYLYVDQGGTNSSTLDLRGSTLSAGTIGLYGNSNLATPDTVYLPDTSHTITIRYDLASSAAFSTSPLTLGGNGGTIQNFANIISGAANDTFIMDYSSFTPSSTGFIDGGGGIDTLDYSNNSTGIIFDIENSTATDLTSMANIENFIGGSGVDQFLMGDANIPGSLDGGAGIDILSYAGRTDSSTIALTNSNLISVESFIGSAWNENFSFWDYSGGAGFSIDAFDGGDGTDSIRVNAGIVDITATPTNLDSIVILSTGELTGSAPISSNIAIFGTGGKLSTSGVITGDVTNQGGIVAPGGTGAIGTLAIQGSYTQTSGVLELEANSPGTAGTDYDYLIIDTKTGTDTVAFTGGDISLVSLAYTPVAGDEFDFILCNSASCLTGIPASTNIIDFSGVASSTSSIVEIISASTTLIINDFFHYVVGTLGFTSTWNGPTTTGTYLWSNPANWSTLPQDGYDVTVPLLAGDVTILFDASAGTLSLNTFNTSEHLSVTGGSLTLGDALTDTSTFATGTSLDLSGGLFGGNGLVNVLGSFNWTGGTLTGTGQLDLTSATGGSINGTVTQSGMAITTPFTNIASGATYNLSGGSLTAVSSANLADGSTFNINGGDFTSGGAVTIDGDLNWSSGSVTSGGVVTIGNTGTVTISGDNTLIATSIINNGIFKKTGGTGTSQLNIGSFTNTGNVFSNSGTLAFGANYTQTAGQLILSGGNVQASSILLNGGLLGGAGLIVGNVTNNATVRPGFSPGDISITGNYTQGSAGVLLMETAGTTIGAYDRLLVTGTASLDGTLDIIPITPYDGNAVIGDSFDFITAGTINGSFSSILTAAGYEYSTSIFGGVFTAQTTAIPSTTAPTSVIPFNDAQIDTVVILEDEFTYPEPIAWFPEPKEPTTENEDGTGPDNAEEPSLASLILEDDVSAGIQICR